MASGDRFLDRLAGFLASLWYRLDARHRRITLRNLEFAYGAELTAAARERLAREVFRQFVLFGWETLELLLAPLSYIRRKVIILGQEHLAAALAQGRGAIAIAAHAGNWEYTVMGYGLQYGPEVVVGRELDHPLGRRLARYLRERAGNQMISKQRGLKEILRHLKQNHTVGIVIDQNTATAEGLLVDFFGHPARTTPVAALLARRGVPVLPTLSRRLPGGRHLMVIFPPIPMEKTGEAQADIRRHLELQNRAIEAWVRAEPAQWLWLHRRWKNQFPEIYERAISRGQCRPKPEIISEHPGDDSLLRTERLGEKMTKPDETFLAAFKERVAAQGISRHFGLELENLSPGQARVGMTCRPDMANILGMVHGTAVFALIDEAFQAACNAHGTVAVALNMNLTFHAAPQMGERLTAQTRELHLGRRTVTYFIEVTDPGGSLVASCQALAYRKDQPLPFGKE